LVRQDASVAPFNGVEVGVAGPRAIQVVLRFPTGAALPLRLSADEARAFAEALRHWAEVSEQSDTGGEARVRGATGAGKRMWSGRPPTPGPRLR
jgi:hypothetical protein